MLQDTHSIRAPTPTPGISDLPPSDDALLLAPGEDEDVDNNIFNVEPVNLMLDPAAMVGRNLQAISQVFHLVVDYLFETASSPDGLRSVQAFSTGLGNAITKVGCYLAGQDPTGEIPTVVDDEGTTQSIFHKMTRWYAPPLQPSAACAPPLLVVPSSTLPLICQPTVDIKMAPVGAAAPQASRSSVPGRKPQSDPKGKGKEPAVPKNQPVAPWSKVPPPQAQGCHPPPVNLSTKPKRSFAQAAQSALSGAPGPAAMDSLASLARAFPDLPLSEIVLFF
jgi:hypothetical protein